VRPLRVLSRRRSMAHYTLAEATPVDVDDDWQALEGGGESRTSVFSFSSPSSTRPLSPLPPPVAAGAPSETAFPPLS